MTTQLINCEVTLLLAVVNSDYTFTVQSLCSLVTVKRRKNNNNNNTGKDKEIDFIRVDGGGDENPAHNETRFMWTKWYAEREKLTTIADVAISKCPLLFTVWTQLRLRSHQNFYKIFTRKQFLPTSVGNAQEQLHFCR